MTPESYIGQRWDDAMSAQPVSPFVIQRKGSPKRGKILNRPSPEWLRDQYIIQGRDANAIARYVGCDGKTAWMWLKEAGIETRKRGYGHPAGLFVKGEPSAFKGRKHPPEALRKIKANTIARGGVPYLKNGVHWLKSLPPSANPKWKGGITAERQTFYRSPEWKEAVKAVWKRDNAICQRCALDHRTIDRDKTKFDIHHIDSFAIVERRCDPDNLILLCEACHYWIHSKHNTERLLLGLGHEPLRGIAA